MNLFQGTILIRGITYLMLFVFGIAGVGYLLGRVTIRGVSLGTAGVFIAALLFGCFFYPQLAAETSSYTGSALKIIENLGLILFVTAVGFIAGPGFFANMKKNITSYVLQGLVIILAGGLSAIACILFGQATMTTDPKELTAMIVGLLSGSLTSTPAFSAAKATVDPALEDIVSVGHGISYLFGVVGVVLFVQLTPKFVHADMETEKQKLVVVRRAEQGKRESGKALLRLDPVGLMPFSMAAVLGIFVGMIRLPLSAQGLSGTTFSLTTTGGCLLLSLIMGHFGRIGRVSILPERNTLQVFRELGLMLFLTGAGISGGANFVKHFETIYFVFGVFMTILPMIAGYLFAKYVLKLSLLNILGSITGGMTSTPALGTLINLTGTDDVASAYAATYPVALIAVVLISQLLILLF